LFGHLSSQSEEYRKNNNGGLSAVFGRVKNWIQGNF